MRRGMMLWKAFGCALTAALTASCSLRLPITNHDIQRADVSFQSPNPDTEQAPDLLIWLIADKYHTALVIPYDWLLESGFTPPADFGHPRYVVMSWGNRDAYSEAGFDHPWKVFRVLFTPTNSVMEFIPVNWDVAEVIPEQRIWRKLVRRDCGPKLAHFLNQCSRSDANGQPVIVCKSSWGDGVQLESRHHYFIPRVCNIWTVQALETLGCDFNAWTAITASGLIRQAEMPPNDFELIWPGGTNEAATTSDSP